MSFIPAIPAKRSAMPPRSLALNDVLPPEVA
jgi:hypothetical protein